MKISRSGGAGRGKSDCCMHPLLHWALLWWGQKGWLEKGLNVCVGWGSHCAMRALLVAGTKQEMGLHRIGIVKQWEGMGLYFFLKQQYLLTSRKKIKCQLHALQSFLQFHVSCRDIQDSGHVRNYLKSDSSTRVIGPAHNRKCRALFRIFELLTHGFCVSKVLFEINFVTIWKGKYCKSFLYQDQNNEICSYFLKGDPPIWRHTDWLRSI